MSHIGRRNPLKYKKVSASNKIELGYAYESGSPNSWFDIDYDFTIRDVSFSDFDEVWVLRGDATVHVVPP